MNSEAQLLTLDSICSVNSIVCFIGTKIPTVKKITSLSGVHFT